MGNYDNFTLAVLVGGAAVIVVFVLMIVLDKKGKEPVAAAPAPTKASGKR
jgi:hypothetical protein